MSLALAQALASAPDAARVMPAQDAAEVGASAGPPSTAHERAKAVEGAPRPDASDGIRQPPPAEIDWSTVGRGLLLPVTRTGELLLGPLRGGAWIYERYRLEYWFMRIFFTDKKELGIFPVVGYQTAYGLTAGGRALVHGRSRESLDVQFAFGGRYRQFYRGTLVSGRKFGEAVKLVFSTGFETRPKERFFGIGNGSRQAVETAPVPVDALTTTDAAYPTRFRQDELKYYLGAPVRIAPRTTLQPSTELAYRWFGPPSELDPGDAVLTDVYDPSTVVGFGTGSGRLYSELAVAFDRRLGTAYSSLPSQGWFAGVFCGYAFDVMGVNVSYLRWGTDLQLLVNLYDNTRILRLRLFFEELLGDLGEIPFVDLPRLGGVDMLRGYDYDRFRDRVVGLLSAEYNFEINQSVIVAFFVDGGRVWRSLSALSLDDMRLGVGAELRLYYSDSLLLRLQLAGSVEGGLLFRFAFNANRDVYSRARR